MGSLNIKLGALSLFLVAFSFGTADAVPVSFLQLSGVTGGLPAGTGVFRADLSGLGIGQIASLTIQDNSSGLGGSPGQFSGFDLDAIVISTIAITDATNVGLLTPAANFDFNNTTFTPGTQRIPIDPRLFGTTPSGTAIDPLIATLAAFDANSTTAIPGAAGFVSLGDNGVLSVNLLSAISISSPLFLYIGEVGNNGEVAASSINVSDAPIGVPEPSTLLLALSSLLAFAGIRKTLS